MKLAIVGYGNMGKMVSRLALEQKHSIAAIVDPLVQESCEGIPFFNSLNTAEGLCGADAAIVFTQPDCALENIAALAEMKMPSVIGTTGWHSQMSEARQAVEKSGTALIWATNFSLGVNIFYRIAWHAASLFDSFPEYDAGGLESHHNKKLDSPSGTAKTLVDGVLERMKRKNKAVWEMLERRPEPNELHYPSLRLGSIPGRHSLFFDSSADSIEITHTARSREGFAFGALRAAQWLCAPLQNGSRRTGFFSVDDMLKDILGL